MSIESFIRKLHHIAQIELDDDVPRDAESLIGVFQVFRPSGDGIDELLSELDCATELKLRLSKLYEIAGHDRRPQGGRDAYFLVRNPPPIDPDIAEQLGFSWLDGLRELALELEVESVHEKLTPVPEIRVLEGAPPKHPKLEHEKSTLLKMLQSEASELIARLKDDPYADAMRPAYYFTACDTMLRDYLMWPFFAAHSSIQDPLEPYFQLWRHGVKYRIFGESQVDLYLPRQTG